MSEEKPHPWSPEEAALNRIRLFVAGYEEGWKNHQRQSPGPLTRSTDPRESDSINREDIQRACENHMHVDPNVSWLDFFTVRELIRKAVADQLGTS